MNQKSKMVRKKTKKKHSFVPKVFTPKTTQEIISYMFKDYDEKTNIFKISVLILSTSVIDLFLTKTHKSKCYT